MCLCVGVCMHGAEEQGVHEEWVSGQVRARWILEVEDGMGDLSDACERA